MGRFEWDNVKYSAEEICKVIEKEEFEFPIDEVGCCTLCKSANSNWKIDLMHIDADTWCIALCVDNEIYNEKWEEFYSAIDSILPELKIREIEMPYKYYAAIQACKDGLEHIYNVFENVIFKTQD